MPPSSDGQRGTSSDADLEVDVLSPVTFLLIVIPSCFVSAAIGYAVAAILFNSGRDKEEATKRTVRRPGPRRSPHIETYGRRDRARTPAHDRGAGRRDAE